MNVIGYFNNKKIITKNVPETNAGGHFAINQVDFGMLCRTLNDVARGIGKTSNADASNHTTPAR